jgi:hypothetical protein
MSNMRVVTVICAAAVFVAGPLPAAARQAAVALSAEPEAPSVAPDDDAPLDLADLLGGGRLKGASLEAAIRKAAGYDLGSRENPVRVSMPKGQHAYLRRLRCADDAAPAFERTGSFGPGVFGSIIDGYRVLCAGGAEPGERTIFMDMYHPDHVETAAPPGFTFKPRAAQP